MRLIGAVSGKLLIVVKMIREFDFHLDELIVVVFKLGGFILFRRMNIDLGDNFERLRVSPIMDKF